MNEELSYVLEETLNYATPLPIPNNFHHNNTHSHDHQSNMELLIAEKYHELTNENMLVAEKYGDITSDNMLVAEKYIESTSENMLVAEKYIESTSENMLVAEKYLERTSENMLVAGKYNENTSDNMLVAEKFGELSSEGNCHIDSEAAEVHEIMIRGKCIANCIPHVSDSCITTHTTDGDFVENSLSRSSFTSASNVSLPRVSVIDATPDSPALTMTVMQPLTFTGTNRPERIDNSTIVEILGNVSANKRCHTEYKEPIDHVLSPDEDDEVGETTMRASDDEAPPIKV